MKVKLFKCLAFIAAVALVAWLLIYVQPSNKFWFFVGASIPFAVAVYSAINEGRKQGKKLLQNPAPHHGDRDWDKEY